MKATDFITCIWVQGIEASAYTILNNTPDSPVTLKMFGEDATSAYGEIPVGHLAAVYLADEEGLDLANAINKSCDSGAPDMLIIADGCAIGLYSLE